MGIELLPKATCNEMEGIMQNFCQGYNTGGKYLFLNNWANLKKSKAIVGLDSDASLQLMRVYS